MAYTKRLYTLQGLATELDLDRRTIAKALSSTQPNGKTSNYDGWYLMTALTALRWIKGRGVVAGGDLDPAQERARKDKELADKTALQNAATRGEMFSGAIVT